MSYTYMSNAMKTIRDLIESDLSVQEIAQQIVQEVRKPEPPLIEDLRSVISGGVSKRIQQIVVNYKTAEKLLAIYDALPAAKKKEFASTPLGTLLQRGEALFGKFPSTSKKSVIDQLRDVIQDWTTGIPSPIQGIQVPYQKAKSIIAMYDNSTSGQKAALSRMTMQQLLNKYSYL